VGCRERSGKRGLLRVVRAPGGRVSVDTTGTSPGRGAYVHGVQSCVQQAVRRGSLARALQASLAEAEVGRLVDELARTMREEER